MSYFSGGRRRRADGAQAPDTGRLYKLLEIEKDASETAIKKAYHKLALKHHPDKGGDPERFKDLSYAYEVLSNPEKRARYDQFGEEGLQESGEVEGSTDAFSIFEQLFGGGRGSAASSRRQRPRTQDVVVPLRVTLEQLYTGATRKIKITRRVINKELGLRSCSACKGQGVRTQVMRMGGMIQQMQSTCEACGGAGKFYETKQQGDVLEVQIPQGAVSGHRLVFREKADEHPDADTGDVILVLEELPHDQFHRHGADLFIKRSISLVEALCGFEIEVQHLDGRRLLLRTGPEEVVRPLAQGFDPLVAGESTTQEWEAFPDKAFSGLDVVATADTTDPEMAKKLLATQLKGRGVGAFVVDTRRQQTRFLATASREDALSALVRQQGCAAYATADPSAKRAQRMMKAVKGEGMPVFDKPFRFGNLFLQLQVEFPEKLGAEVQDGLRQLLPPPLHPPVPKAAEDPQVELHQVTELDPVDSFREYGATVKPSPGEAYDEASDEGKNGSGFGANLFGSLFGSRRRSRL